METHPLKCANYCVCNLLAFYCLLTIQAKRFIVCVRVCIYIFLSVSDGCSIVNAHLVLSVCSAREWLASSHSPSSSARFPSAPIATATAIPISIPLSNRLPLHISAAVPQLAAIGNKTKCIKFNE